MRRNCYNRKIIKYINKKTDINENSLLRKLKSIKQDVYKTKQNRKKLLTKTREKEQHHRNYKKKRKRAIPSKKIMETERLYEK